MPSLTPFPPDQQPHHHIISFPSRATIMANSKADAVITMTSLELVEFINEFRRMQAMNAGQGFPSRERPELRHDNFMSKVPEVLGEGGVLNFKETYRHPQNGQEYPCYRFPKREACLMAMSYSYELQAAVYDRMTELEEQARGPILPNFSDPVLAARAWADAQEQKLLAEKKALALEAQAAEDRPLVGFAKAVQASEDTILIRQLAGFLKQNGIDIGQNRLFEWLRNNGYLCRERGESWNRPTQKSMDLGLFETKQSIGINPDGTTRIFLTTKVTGKGQVFFLRKFGAVANNKNTPNDPAAAPEEAPAS